MDEKALTSITLCRYLDHLELSKDDVDSRVSMYRHLEILAGAVDYQADFQPTIITGSTMDGVCWKGYMSDLDTMILVPYVSVVQALNKVGENTKGFFFLMDNENVHPGYTYLKLCGEDQDMAENMFSMTPGGVKALCSKSKDDDFYLSAYKMKRCFMRYQHVHEKSPWVIQVAYHYAIEWPDDDEVLEHGPSVCFSDKSKDDTPNDAVPCFACAEWPSQAAEWITRNRQWPSEQKVKEIASRGCNVVPVGFIGSQTRDIEWRISFALAERELVKSFNNTQHKCYALLKMFLKEFLLNDKADGLTSFHMKNTLLWTIERSDPGIWCPEKITEAIQMCIKNLHSWLESGKCPSYFIPQNNVFDGKVEGSDRIYFRDCLEEFKDNPDAWKILLECKSLKDDGTFIKALGHIQNTKDPSADIDFLPVSSKSDIWFQHDMRLFPRYEHARVEIMAKINAEDDARLAISEHYSQLEELERRKPRTGYSKAMDPLQRALESSLGSHLHALALSEEKDTECMSELFHLAEKYLSQGMQSDATSGKLKLANFHFMNGSLSKCLELAEEVIENDHLLPDYVPQLLPALQGPSAEQIQRYQTFVQQSPHLTTEERFLDGAAHAVIFLPSELNSAPDAVRHQLRRVLPDPLDFTSWLRWAVYDPLVYAHFLCYVSYFKQDKLAEAESSLVKIERMLDQGEVGYELSCLNLLGYSYLSLLKSDKAVLLFLKAAQKDIIPTGVVWQLSESLCSTMKPMKPVLPKTLNKS